MPGAKMVGRMREGCMGWLLHARTLGMHAQHRMHRPQGIHFKRPTHTLRRLPAGESVPVRKVPYNPNSDGLGYTPEKNTGCTLFGGTMVAQVSGHRCACQGVNACRARLALSSFPQKQ